jgi:hypothetical protein
MTCAEGKTDRTARKNGNDKDVDTREGMLKDDDKKSTSSSESDALAASRGHKKEKSVLQAKLTKLAIKIGNIGNTC